MLESTVSKLQEEKVYVPTFNDKKKKFEYKKDPKRLKYVKCPTCAIRIYHEGAVAVSTCNQCGFQKPTTKKKLMTIKKRCDICGKKRKVQSYIMAPSNTELQLCKRCYTEEAK